jgi:hypothetical protein
MRTEETTSPTGNTSARRNGRWRALRYVGGPFDRAMAVVGFYTDDQVPERLTVTAAPYHFERDGGGIFRKINDGDGADHRYRLEDGPVVVFEREVTEEHKRQVTEEDPETGEKVKRMVTELVKRKVPVVDRGAYRYVGAGAWPEDEADG